MLENNLQYNDEYIYFAFNGVHSSKYNLMIQNNIDDFKIITNENTSIDYASPKYQKGRYMMGVTRSHRTIPHKLVSYGLTRAEANQVAEWLRVGYYGPLIYDYAPDWQYNVVVSKLGDMNLYPIEDGKHFIVSFEIAFETLEGTDAENTQNAIIMLHSSQIQNNGLYFYGLNNSKLIPATACYNIPSTSPNPLKDYVVKDNNKIIIPLYIHHLGTGHSLLNLSANVGQDSAQLSIESDSIDHNASISYIIGEQYYNPIIIDYKAHNHLFFLNNEIPEYKELYKEIQNLHVKYSNNSIIFKSPGNISKVLNVTNEEIKKLTATPYKWFFYGTNQETEATTPYYQLYANSMSTASKFPREASGQFFYDSEFITKTDNINIVDYDNQSQVVNNYTVDVDDLLEHLNIYTHIYFGYYDKATITCKPMTDIVLSITQYNNLLLGGQI